ncbi:MAG: hypothetical protein WBX25_04645 [Rhodomicrobium sp.]
MMRVSRLRGRRFQNQPKAQFRPRNYLRLCVAEERFSETERVWLYLKERFLSHRLLDDYGAIVAGRVRCLAQAAS